MPNRTAFPDCTPVPSDPHVRLTAAQLQALFPDTEANQRFANTLTHLTPPTHKDGTKQAPFGESIVKPA